MVQENRELCRDEAVLQLSNLSTAALRASCETPKAGVERNSFRLDSRHKPFDGRIPQRFRVVQPTQLVVAGDRTWPLLCEPLERR